MEQQTISVSKAGFVCKLNSRCSIIAGMNPKDPKKAVASSSSTHELEIGLNPTIITRFDLIFILEQVSIKCLNIPTMNFNLILHFTGTRPRMGNGSRRTHF
jgi:hypothetical protein